MAAPQSPNLSVVMPVHNALPHLERAIRSIVDQTFRDFEFVVLDDASTDGSTKLLREWAARDSRIKLFETKTNLGPAGSSNRVVAHASGQIIARMDADDIAHPERLRRELELLERNPEVGLVGSLFQIIDPEGNRLRGAEPWRLSRRSWFAPFPHGSIMYRRPLFESIGGYRSECEFWEDLDLALRMRAKAPVLVIPHALYEHRQSFASTRVCSRRERVERAVDLMYRCVDRLDEGGSYEDLLAKSLDPERRLDPRVFIAIGALELWAGGKPRLFRRLLKRGRLQFDFGSASALVWTAWASINAPSLRGALGLLARARNSPARKAASGAEAVAWCLPGQIPQPSRASTGHAHAAPEAAAGR